MYTIFTNDEVTDKDELNYGVIKYIKYDFPCRSDHAKKTLEKNIVNKYIHNWKHPQKISLDIGCATGRYPLWLASNGFETTGYDIDQDAINITNQKIKHSEASNLIHIHKRNILDIAPETSKYSLITCMMGTFNHIFPRQQEKFLSWIHQSLMKDGLFIFTSWNIDSEHMTFLDFYSHKEIQQLRHNLLPIKVIKTLLHNIGFSKVETTPIVMLSDNCYENWNELDDKGIIDIDQYLSNTINPVHAQMNIIMAR